MVHVAPFGFLSPFMGEKNISLLKELRVSIKIAGSKNISPLGG